MLTFFIIRLIKTFLLELEGRPVGGVVGQNCGRGSVRSAGGRSGRGPGQPGGGGGEHCIGIGLLAVVVVVVVVGAVVGVLAVDG